MTRIKRIAAATALVVTLGLGATACFEGDATVASENVSKAADNFEVQRRIVMFNGITDKYLMVVVGACSITDEGNQLEIICKTGKDEYVKEFAGLSDVDFRGSSEDLPTSQ